MQFIADILKRLNEENKITKEGLYKLKESEVINIIESSKYSNIFNIWKNAKKVKTSKEEPKDVYYVNHGAKIRYINPLFKGVRISKCCKIANKMIENNLSYNMCKCQSFFGQKCQFKSWTLGAVEKLNN